MDTNCKRLIMLLLLFNFIVPLSSTHADEETNGFLLFKIERNPYNSENGQQNGPFIQQSFKVPLTAEFMSQFKYSTNHGMGTGFYCGSGNTKTDDGSTWFTWWIHRTAENHWSINMWGHGSETLDGVKLDSPYPTASQYMTIKELQDLDMGYQLSFFAPSGRGAMNVSFEAKYLSAQDARTLEAIPVASVKRADRTMLFKGDDQRGLPLGMRCGFQE